MAKIELPESWAGVAGPLHALMVELERQAHADSPAPSDLAAVTARWARVSDSIRAMVRTRIADVQATPAPKR
jgi:hypothetical protein